MSDSTPLNIDLIPSYDEMAYYVIRVLITLNESGSNQEIYENVEENLRQDSTLDEELINYSKPNMASTLVRSRIGWAISVLRKMNIILSPQRGINILNRKNKVDYESITKEDVREQILIYQRKRDIERFAKRKIVKDEESEDKSGEEEGVKDVEDEEGEGEEEYLPGFLSLKENTYQYLINLTPKEFENFCARLLRQMGLAEVETTGQVGDQGIDIMGTLMLNDLVPQKVRIQCKKYQSTNLIGAPQIQQFRGALSAEQQGIFITTSRYTEPSKHEAIKDGFKRIRLIDFDELFELMKKYQVGIKKIETINFELSNDN